MKYVLDTNVLKQFSKLRAQRNPNVNRWLADHDDKQLYITTLSAMEMQKGIESLRKRGLPNKVALASQMERDLNALLKKFGERMLVVDTAAAREWGRRLTKHGTKNCTDLGIISVVSTQGPAAAVTQNESDFRHRGIRTVNPFKDPAPEFNDVET
jgi:toxin FitB